MAQSALRRIIGNPLETEAQRMAQAIPTPVNRNFVRRYMMPENFPAISNPDGTVSTHRMSSAEVDGRNIAYPTIIQDPATGKLTQLDDDQAFDYALRNNEYLTFPDQQSAQAFAEGGYKSNGMNPPRNMQQERMDARRARIGMEPYDRQAQTKTAGQAMADMLGGMALATAPIPVVGDLAGAVSDAAMYAAYPEERTMLNAGMSLAGLVPFVPGGSALRALRDAPSVNLIDDGKGKALIMSEGKQAGVIEYEINNGAVQIKGSKVNPSRSGIGTEAYKQFINSKMDEGLSVGSDNIVSQQAEGLYKKLASQGYQITENPNNRRIYPGSLTSVSRDSMRSQRSAHPTEYRDGAIQSAPGFVLRGDPVYQITRRPQDAPLPSPLEGTLDMSQAAKTISTLPGRNELKWWVDGGQDAVERGFPEEPFILLDKLYIDPQNRGQGIARKVLQEGLNDMATQHPGMDVRLLAEPLDRETNLSDLVRLYESVGFDIDDYQDGMSGVPMSLRLPNPQTKK